MYLGKKSACKHPLIAICLVFLILTACDRYKNGIREGEEVLSKSLFFGDDTEANKKSGNSIKTIQVGNFDSSSENVVIFNNDHCYIFDARTRYRKKTIKFSQLGYRPELLSIKYDGSMEIMIRGGGFDDVGLVNRSGEFIWKYKRAQGTSPHMTARKYDDKAEFYIADFDGLHKLDDSGKQIWKVNDKVGERDIQIYEPKSMLPVTVTRSNNGNIRYWNESGQLTWEVIPEIESYGLEIIYWPDDYHILASGDYEIIIMDLNGKVSLQYKLKKDILPFFVHLLEIMDIRGVPVKLDLNRQPYLAVIAKHRAALKKSTLSIFTPEGQLIYQEMLNSTTGINTLINPDGSESLLVGDGNKVWIYTMRK